MTNNTSGNVTDLLVRKIRNQPFVSWMAWLSLGLGLLILAVPIADPAALYSFRVSGGDGLSVLTTLGALSIILMNFLFIGHSWLNLSREQFIYRNAVKSAIFHASLGTLIGVFIVAPYGLLDWRNLGLSVFLVFAVTSVSFGTWTYWRLQDLYRASERLIWSPHAEYQNVLGLETSSDQVDERVSICRECLSLVGNNDTTCWRCDNSLHLQAERLVAFANPSRRPH